jgi:hypothetical protein
MNVRKQAVWGAAKAVVAGWLLAAGCGQEVSVEGRGSLIGHGYAPRHCQAKTPRQWAEYWAPRIYQDVERGHSRFDQLTKFNWDGNYVGRDNWENANRVLPIGSVRTRNKPAFVYYSFSESDTHVFLGYYFFHPRDWNDSPVGGDSEHENDLEAALFLIDKAPAEDEAAQAKDCYWGALVAVIAQEHGHLDLYLHPKYEGVAGEHRDSSGWIDSRDFGAGRSANVQVPHNPHRPCVAIESQGHGVFNALPGMKRGCGLNEPNGDSGEIDLGGTFLVYEYGGRADLPGISAGCYLGDTRTESALMTQFPCSYELISLDAGEGTIPAGQDPSDPTGARLGEDQGLWHLRESFRDNADVVCAATDSCPFASFLTMRGDDQGGCGLEGDLGLQCPENSAGTPWGWDDPDGDGPTFRGDSLCDPAHFWESRLRGSAMRGEAYSHTYRAHSYWTWRVKLHSVTAGSKDRQFVHVRVDGQAGRVIAGGHFSRTLMRSGRQESVRFGATDGFHDDFVDGRPYNRRYLASPQAGELKVRLMGSNQELIDAHFRRPYSKTVSLRGIQSEELELTVESRQAL